MGDRTDRQVVGVVGGGPLCLLLGREALRKGLPVDLIGLDPAADCPARPVLQRQIVADVHDREALLQLAGESDVLTLATEQANGALFEGLEGSRAVVHPSPATLRALRDTVARLPVSKADAAARLSVIAARSTAGEIRTGPAAEVLRDGDVLRMTVCPARVDAATARAAEALAHETLKALPGAGVFAVGMAVDPQGGVRIQEIAPRVHAAGHFTIEACRTSQFEQHLRAITGMPLGDPTLLYSAVVVPLYGAPGLQGPVVLEGVDGVRQIPGAAVHLYGKKETAPGKMLGHLTLIDVNDPGYRDALVHRAEHVRTMIVQKEAKR